MSDLIQIERNAGVATLWLNRPDKHNAFDEHLIAAITDGLRALTDDAQVRVVVLAGRGKSFSAGGDLDWMRRAAGYGYDQNLADATALATMLRTLAELPKPTIARVHGAALGGGMGLVCACDIAVASDVAVFATSEVKFGLIPATIGPYVLRAIGTRQAQRYFQSAERIDAARAVQIGLVHELVGAASLDAKIDEITTALHSGGPAAQNAAKQFIADVANRPISDTLISGTAEAIARIRATDEAREGLTAFLEKRKANWA
ncbi:enoyl-CoA hydratase/isomerase family protein [Xanthomonadaceae bacterium JHOS43]|nr:enoyl-CoA hydratase/isomerase family protein [Xanthomonadaceae bacterium JHOS43]